MLDFAHDPQLGYDFDQREPVPTGNYLVKVVTTKYELTQNGAAGTGERKLSVHLEIQEGEYKDRIIFVGLNVESPKTDVQRAALKSLNAICAVTKVFKITARDDADAGAELRGQYLRVDVVSNGGYNNLKGVYSVDGLKPGQSIGQPAQVAPAPVVSAAPAQYAPQMPQVPQVPQMPPQVQTYAQPQYPAQPQQPAAFAPPAPPAPLPQMPQQAPAVAANPFQMPGAGGQPVQQPQPQWPPAQ